MNRIDIPFLLKKSDLIGAEIGVDKGIFSEDLLKTNLFKEFIAIDPWPSIFPGVFIGQQNLIISKEEANSTYLEAKAKIEKYKNTRVIRAFSTEAKNLFADESFDFIFLDADHTYTGVKSDLENWYPKIKPGGILAGHDYVDLIMHFENDISSHFGVKKAVDEFFGQQNLKIQVTSTNQIEKHPSWYVFKPLAPGPTKN